MFGIAEGTPPEDQGPEVVRAASSPMACEVDVDGLSDRRQHADGLARADGLRRAAATGDPDRLGRPRLPGDRHAAGHRRHPADPGAEGAGGRLRSSSPRRRTWRCWMPRRAWRCSARCNIPVLGVVENMAVHICSNCGHAEHLFGEGRRREAGGAVRCRAAGLAAAVDGRSASRPMAASQPRLPSLEARSPWSTRNWRAGGRRVLSCRKRRRQANAEDYRERVSDDWSTSLPLPAAGIPAARPAFNRRYLRRRALAACRPGQALQRQGQKKPRLVRAGLF